MQRILLFAAGALLCLGAPANLLLATDYFVVNSEGATGGDGSAADPWGTITEALTTGSFQPGDVIHVAAGAYSDTRGESFPLVLPDGVCLSGAGPGGSLIEDAGLSDAPLFRLGGISNPTSVKGFSFEVDSTVFSITSSVASFTIKNCSQNGYIASNTPDLIAFSGSYDVNVRVSGCWFMYMDNICSFFIDGGASGSIYLRDNQFVYGTSAICYFSATSSAQLDIYMTSNHCAYNYAELYGSAEDGAGLDVMVCSNEFLMDEYGLSLSWAASTSGSTVDGTLLVKNNNWNGLSSYVWSWEASAYNSGVVNLAVSAYGNILENGTSYAAILDWSAWSSGVLNLTAVIECNDFINNYYTGYSSDVSAWGSGVVVCDLVIRQNIFSGNGSTNVVLDASAWSNGRVDYRLAFYQNGIMGALSDPGLDLELSAWAGGSFGQMPDFGGGPLVGMPGCNTIRSNELNTDPNTGTVTSVSYSGSSNGSDLDVFFQGNFWFSASPASIESRVYHQPDGNNGTVDFSAPLPGELSFTGPLAATAGQLVVLTATGSSKFVEKYGQTRISILVDGIPVGDAGVSADGSLVSFLIPAGVVFGNGEVVVSNPGGQIGAIVMALSLPGGGNGRCFVATAAYGDDEAPEVLLLRRWRDESLSTNALGRLFVKAYYAVSPPLAEAIAESPAARTVSRAALAPMVGAVKLWLDAPWLTGLAGAALVLLLLRRRR